MAINCGSEIEVSVWRERQRESRPRMGGLGVAGQEWEKSERGGRGKLVCEAWSLD